MLGISLDPFGGIKSLLNGFINSFKIFNLISKKKKRGGGNYRYPPTWGCPGPGPKTPEGVATLALGPRPTSDLQQVINLKGRAAT